MMYSVKKEYKNILKRSCHPFFFIRLCFFIFTRVIANIKRRFLSPAFFYPNSVKKGLNEIRKIYKNSAVNFNFQKNNDEYLKSKVPLIKIFNELLRFSSKNTWKVSFVDSEKTSALHRFFYLLQGDFLKAGSGKYGVYLIKDWIFENQSVGGVSYESYTVSERISNIILFFLYHQTGSVLLTELSVDKDIFKSLEKQSLYLINHLEYHEKESTGNHVLNNARALYFFGRMFKKEAFSLVAVEILRYSLPIVIDKNGFLREGSSHYQFLVTRWILEVSIIAILTGDNNLVFFLKKYLEKMIEACVFFLVYNKGKNCWDIPLFGDVSPDCAWEWLIGLPWSKIANNFISIDLPESRPKEIGWIDLVDRIFVKSVPKKLSPLKSQLFFKDSGWYRISYGIVTLFGRTEPTGSPLHASHAHCDIGSFVLYLDGEQVFTDIGRLNYQLNDPLGLYGVSAAAHNAITIDDFDPYIYHARTHFPQGYRTEMIKMYYQNEDDCLRLQISHAGFSRMSSKNITYQREFLIYEKNLMIVDNFYGNESHEIKSYFHFSPNLVLKDRLKDNCVGISSRSFKMLFSFDKKINSVVFEEEDLWHHYGVSDKTHVLIGSVECVFPFQLKYQLNWS